MDASQVHRTEHAIDVAAALVFAAAAAVAALFFGLVPAVGAGIAAFCIVFRLLQSIGTGVPDFPLQAFAPADLPAATVQIEELALTDADRFEPPKLDENELVLEDVLAELSDNSRVIRLFDAAAMPSPTELKARIDHHLKGGAPTPSPDASKALHEALFELRKSLR
jgi:hypothetical protein